MVNTIIYNIAIIRVITVVNDSNQHMCPIVTTLVIVLTNLLTTKTKHYEN